MATLTVNYKAFPSNALLATVSVSVVTGAVDLTAPGFYTTGGSPPPIYEFLFWDANGSREHLPEVKFTAPGDTSNIFATAWYEETGPGNGGTGVTTYAFSLNQDKVLPNTPIASVNPAVDWIPSGSATVSTTASPGPVQITALNLITGSGAGLFTSWLQFGDGVSSGKILTVPYKGASQAIAFYRIPQPDPCQATRNELAALSAAGPAGSGLSVKAFEVKVAALTKVLLACEEENGEST